MSPPTLTPWGTAERAQCTAIACLLHTSRLWGHAALLATLATLWATAQGWGPLSTCTTTAPPAFTPALLALALLLLLAERYLASRVQLDAQLFHSLATAELPDLASLDGALQTVLGVPASKAGRSLALRWAGARRLYRAHLTTTLALLACTVAAWWPHKLSGTPFV